MRPLVLACAIALMACSTMSAQNSVAALEVGLTGAETAAGVYAQLPPCGAASKLCSDAAIVGKIKAADNAAYAAVKAAEATAAAGGSPDLTASVAALSALQALIPTGEKP